MRIDKSKIHLLIGPEGPADIILVEYGSDVAEPFQSRTGIGQVNDAIFAAIEFYVLPFGDLYRLGKQFLEIGSIDDLIGIAEAIQIVLGYLLMIKNWKLKI